jgi:ketosteroid isomerase-like protein
MKAKISLLAALLLANGYVWAADPASDEEQLKKIEQDWATAYVKRDKTFVERITSADFAFIGPDGSMVNKEEYVKSMDGDTVFSAFKVDELKVRIYGDAAVVLGIASITATAQGENESGRYSFTDIFVKQKGEWKAVSGQITAVARDEATE